MPRRNRQPQEGFDSIQEQYKFKRYIKRLGRQHFEENPPQSGGTERNPYKHPKGLKGKNIGLWYRDLKHRFKDAQDNGASSSGLPAPPSSFGEESSAADTSTNDKKSQNPNSYFKMFRSQFHPIGLSNNRKQEIQHLLNTKQPEKFGTFQDSYFKEEFTKIVKETFESKLNKTVEEFSDTHNDTNDNQYLQDYLNTNNNNIAYKIMKKGRMLLPAYAQKDELLKIIRDNQVVVVSGETGCGKTTQLAQFVLDDYISKGVASRCKIICTQPRRISAVTVSERVAQERAEKLGQSVGYQIRLERVLPRQYGSITFATTGVILTQMIIDPTLSSVSHLIIDEIHERDVLSDFILTLAKLVIEKRTDLKLILMSATLNAEKFSAYFNNCPHINIPGCTYPVKEFYLEDVLNITKFTFPYEPRGRKLKHQYNNPNSKQQREFSEMIEPHVRLLEKSGAYSRHACIQLRNMMSELLDVELIYELVSYICTTQDEGAILVFLPGYGDISKLIELFTKSGRFPPSRFVIYGLHSQMPTAQQKEIFLRPCNGTRKIIVATNIAETSITIEDVVFVVDGGKIKMSDYDSKNNSHTLNVNWVSLANAHQRRGRAGRVKPGICYHLYSKAREMLLDQYQTPEILRTRLEETILRMKILQLGDARTFLQRFMDPPEAETIERSIDLLRQINALDQNEQLTPLGYHLSKLPIHPQMGKMILLGAMFSCLDPILSIAACLGFKDPFVRPLGKEEQVDQMKRELSDGMNSDHLLMYHAIARFEDMRDDSYAVRQFCWHYYLNRNTLELLVDMKKQFLDYLYDMKFVVSNKPNAAEHNVNSSNMSLIKAIVCAGLYPNVAFTLCTLRGNKKRRPIRTLDCNNAKIHPNSILNNLATFVSPVLIYFKRVHSTALYLHDVSIVHPLPLLFFGENTSKVTNPEHTLISLNDRIQIKCDDTTADIVLQLKDRLNILLEYKVSHPGTVDWSTDNKETDILKAIMELITHEDTGDMLEEYYANDEDAEDDD